MFVDFVLCLFDVLLPYWGNGRELLQEKFRKRADAERREFVAPLADLKASPLISARN
jgi:hypothetical protein